MALGAYTVAILTVEYSIPWFGALILAGVVAMVLAYLIGVPTLKLMGDYYAIASIGLGEAIRLIIENWQSVTRGARGYPGIEAFTTLPVAVGVLVIMAAAMFFLVNSNFGRAFKACRGRLPSRVPLGLPHRQLPGPLPGHLRLLLRRGGGASGGVHVLHPAGHVRHEQVHGAHRGGGVRRAGIHERIAPGDHHHHPGDGAVPAHLPVPHADLRLVLVLIMVIRPEGLMGQHELNRTFFAHLFGGRRKKEPVEEGR